MATVEGKAPTAAAGDVAGLLSAFKASPLDDVLAALAASLAAQQSTSAALRETLHAQQARHDVQMREAEVAQQRALAELRDRQENQAAALAKSIRESEAARAEQAEISKRALANQRELLEYQAKDIATLQSRCATLEASIVGAQAAAEAGAKKQRDDASSSNKALEEHTAEQARLAIQSATHTHAALVASLESITTKLSAKQSELDAAFQETKSEEQGGPFNASQHLADLLALSTSVHNSLAPELTQYGIHIEFAQRQVSWLQRLQIRAPGQAPETTLVDGLNNALTSVLKERTAMLDNINALSAFLNQTFVNFQDMVLGSAHNKTVDYCETSLAPRMRGKLLEHVEGLIAAQSKSIVAAAAEASRESSSPSSQSKSKSRSAQKQSRKQKGQQKKSKATVPDPDGGGLTEKPSTSSSTTMHDGAADNGADPLALTPKHGGQKSQALDDGDDDGGGMEEDFFSESSDSEGEHGDGRGSRALLETERLANGLQKLRENISSRIEAAVTKVRNQTTSTQENVKGIFVRIGEIETNNEVLDNAVAAIRFTMDSMKLWKQDMQSEIEQMRESIPETPEPYDDSQLQEQLGDLAKKATTSLLQLRDLNNSKSKHEEAFKVALEEQGSAIAHLVASKADQAMVEKGLNAKADSALESGIRDFMKKVALDIDDRDYRSGKIASSERAQLETRILRMVTSSLRRIRRQQSMLSKALPQGLGGQAPLMAGIVYKCLACERPSPPSILDPTNQNYSLVMSGGSGLLEDKHLHHDRSERHDFDSRARATHPYSSSAGSLTMRRPVTAPHAHGIMSSKSTLLDLSADPAQQARRNVHTHSPYKVKGAGFRVANKYR